MEAVTSLSFHSMVAGGQRDTRTELVETVVGLSVSSNFHAHDDAMYAMTLTRTRTVWRGGGKWEDADVSRRTTAKTPKTINRWDLDNELKKTN